MKKQKTVLHFVRHGEVENPQKLRYGRLAGFHLSEQGRKQVEETSLFFLKRRIQHIYSSPMERAQQTATLLGMTLSYAPITLDARLLEVKTPAHYEGKVRDSAFYYPALTSREAEAPQDIVLRLRHFIEEKVSQHNGGEIIVVGHGDPIALLIDCLVFNSLNPKSDPYPSYASISSFIFFGLELQSVWYHNPTPAGSIRG